ncbi:MAG TPA: ester cyclase [Gaiellaceae bacterium]
MPTQAQETTRLVEAATVPGQRAESVIRFLEGNRTLGSRLFAPTYKEHKPWRTPNAKKTFRAKALFPDLKVSVEDAFESGDRVVVRWRAQGTHSGKIPAVKNLAGKAVQIKPTGNKVDFTGITIYRFAGGRIVESWGQMDVPTLAAQCQRIGPEIYEYLGAVRAVRVAPTPGPVVR